MKTETVPRMCTNVLRMWANRRAERVLHSLITPYVDQSGAFPRFNYPVCVHLLIYQGVVYLFGCLLGSGSQSIADKGNAQKTICMANEATK